MAGSPLRWGVTGAIAIMLLIMAAKRRLLWQIVATRRLAARPERVSSAGRLDLV